MCFYYLHSPLGSAWPRKNPILKLPKIQNSNDHFQTCIEPIRLNQAFSMRFCDSARSNSKKYPICVDANSSRAICLESLIQEFWVHRLKEKVSLPNFETWHTHMSKEAQWSLQLIGEWSKKPIVMISSEEGINSQTSKPDLF